MKGLIEEEIRNVIMFLMFFGVKMFDRYCLRCGLFFFEKDGRVFCLVCEYRERKRKVEMKEEVKDVEERLREKLI